MTFRYGFVTVRVRQPLGGFTGTARGGRPAVASRLCRQRSTPHARRYQPGRRASRLWVRRKQRMLLISRLRSLSRSVRCLARAGDTLHHRPTMSANARTEQMHFASRAGLKLDAALSEFDVDIDGSVVADLGSSTGGFVDVLLRRGAAKVYAVEKGFGLLDWRLRNDRRVTVMERTDARTVELPEEVALVTIDVGFARQSDVVPQALSLLAPGGRIVSLLKPQYEAGGRDLVRGKLTPETSDAVVRRVVAELREKGVDVERTFPSPVRGKEANAQEVFLLVTS
jgi:23S rRNA (cytidine1920-2'-O)/16S rRNA (cytidine1409-2'-O)-methyltransferase